MEKMIEVAELSKKINGRKIIDQLTFTVKKGEVFGLLGPNGAGKTTTIETILGIKTPEEGSVKILGSDPQKSDVRYLKKWGYSFNLQVIRTIFASENCAKR